MGRFPTAGRLISWAGLCPRNDESAGKRRSTRLRKGAPWLKTTLVQCAWAASRKKVSYLQGPIPAPALSSRTQESHLRRRRLDPHRRLPHAPRRRLLPRSRRGPLPPRIATSAGRPPRPTDRKTRLHLHARTHPTHRGFCLQTRPEAPPGYISASVRLRRNDGQGASFIESGAQGERLVGDESIKIDARYERLDPDAIVPLQQDEARQIAQRIDERDDLGGQPSARPADGLILSPPFAPAPCR